MFDTLLHSHQLSDEFLDHLAYFGTTDVLITPGEGTASTARILRRVDEALEREVQRCARAGLRARVVLGVPKRPERAHPELWTQLADRLAHPHCAAVGGVSPTPNDPSSLQRHAELAAQGALPLLVRLRASMAINDAHAVELCAVHAALPLDRVALTCPTPHALTTLSEDPWRLIADLSMPSWNARSGTWPGDEIARSSGLMCCSNAGRRMRHPILGPTWLNTLHAEGVDESMRRAVGASHARAFFG